MTAAPTDFPGYMAEKLLYEGPTTRVWQVRVLVPDSRESGRGSSPSTVRPSLALKEFLSPRLSPMLRELANLVQLRHRHIVRCLDAGLTLSGRAYLVFELSSRGSLRARLQQGRLTRSEWRSLAGQLLQALQAAHEQRLVHQDLKPENVLLFGRERPLYKLADLGLSKALGQASAAEAGGTPAYMAPEQFAGATSPRSDLYSLGVLLYEAGLGRLPFQGDYRELRQQHDRAPLDWADWPYPGVQSWLARLLEKKPESRPASAAEALAELRGKRPTGPAAAAQAPAAARSGECWPVFRHSAEGCQAVLLPFRQGRRQLWACRLEGSRVWESQAGGWVPRPAGPGAQCGLCAPGDSGLWLAERNHLLRLEWGQTRPQMLARTARAVDALWWIQGRLLVLMGRRLAAYSAQGELAWFQDLPHYWGPVSVAPWGSDSLAAAIGPSPARLLRLARETGQLEDSLSLPVPCLAAGGAPGGQVALVLSDLSHFGDRQSGIWTTEGGALEQRAELPGQISWARAHGQGFSVGLGGRATWLLDFAGRVLTQVAASGVVSSDAWSEDGSVYAWVDEGEKETSVRVARLLPFQKGNP